MQVPKKMSHNVPAVGDGFVARIRACKARPGLQNCGWSRAWECLEETRPSPTEPRAAD